MKQTTVQEMVIEARDEDHAMEIANTTDWKEKEEVLDTWFDGCQELK